MAELHDAVLKLQDGHTWTCKPGYKIFVLDQGALRLDVPHDWIMELGESSVRFYDCQPPDDNCRLEISLLRHPRADWSQLPLDQLLRRAAGGAGGYEVEDHEVHRQIRPGVELAWLENIFVDPKESKSARSRIAIVRGSNSHALVTLDFWEADAGRVFPAWDEVMNSIEMGLKVQDPTVGERRM